MPDEHTKIVATLGPASLDRATIGAMAAAGVDVLRLNFSHGRTQDHRDAARRVREISRETGRNLALLQDLPGPKIRIGRFANGEVELSAGQTFSLVADDVVGDRDRVSVSFGDLSNEVGPDQVLLLDDGNLRLRVTAVESGRITTAVEVGGPLKDLKGVNVPGVHLSLPAITESDVRGLELGIELDVDWVAQSFVQAPEDVELARNHLERIGSQSRLMAKIETPLAVERFDDILALADGVMVARGDLGVEMAPEEVPVIQKQLIATAHEAGKPVITATQMLESMIENARPTRAETSDVANAIFDGTDAVMLSAETAIGRYPVESVAMMRRVASVVEASAAFEQRQQMLRPEAADVTPGAIAKAACETAETLSARAIVVFTASGSSAWRIARNRPRIPTLALTPSAKVRACLALAFGVRSEQAPVVSNADEMVSIATDQVRLHGMAETGDRIVITAGVPFGVTGTTNLVWVERVS